MRLGAPSLQQLVRQARDETQVFLPHVVPHPAGTWIGLGAVGLGAWAHERDVSPVVQWVALGGLLVGMWLYARLKRSDAGWLVDFASRSIAPRGLPGGPVSLDDSGWSLACAPGERRSSVAIDLRHADRGRVARLYDSGPRLRGARMTALNELADVLAERLRIGRSGPRL
ncbi:MAG: hypothetical protein MUE62_10585 [Burkholderiaceae bacterium]|jgi:hypothetical protein|nr:hypothetical protein [Burkholderiaceae bacterium]